MFFLIITNKLVHCNISFVLLMIRKPIGIVYLCHEIQKLIKCGIYQLDF